LTHLLEQSLNNLKQNTSIDSSLNLLIQNVPSKLINSLKEKFQAMQQGFIANRVYNKKTSQYLKRHFINNVRRHYLKYQQSRS